MNSVYRIVAVLIGGFIMKTIALYFNLHPIGVAFSAVVGAVVGWVLYDVPALIRAGVEAYNWLSNTKVEINLWPFFKGLGIFLANMLLTALNMSFVMTYFILIVMVLCGGSIVDMILGSMLFGVITGAVFSMFGILAPNEPYNKGKSQPHPYLDTEFLKALAKWFVIYTNPIAAAFWVLYGVFYYLPKKTPTIASFGWKFSKKTFAIAHNGARRLCAIDSVLCGSAWLVSGNDPYVGIMVGTMLGIFHYRLTGAWAKMTLEKIRLESETKEIARIQGAMNSITGYRE